MDESALQRFLKAIYRSARITLEIAFGMLDFNHFQSRFRFDKAGKIS